MQVTQLCKLKIQNNTQTISNLNLAKSSGTQMYSFIPATIKDKDIILNDLIQNSIKYIKLLLISQKCAKPFHQILKKSE